MALHSRRAGVPLCTPLIHCSSRERRPLPPNGPTDVPDSPFDDYLDLVEAARELGIHPQSLRRLIKQGRVPATLFAGKYLIERDKLDMFKSSYDPRPGRKPIRRLL
ncbi:MAG: DNA-binding protein [Dehalococcoidia bacterium]|nr:DNA-binding protein [Dehalococcoidia bacterium]